MRRWRLPAAAAHHWFSLDEHVRDPGKVSMSDGVGSTGPGRALHRPANHEISHPTRSKNPYVQPVRACGIAGCDGDRFPRRPQTEHKKHSCRSMPRGMTPVPPGVSVPMTSR